MYWSLEVDPGGLPPPWRWRRVENGFCWWKPLRDWEVPVCSRGVFHPRFFTRPPGVCGRLPRLVSSVSIFPIRWYSWTGAAFRHASGRTAIRPGPAAGGTQSGAGVPQRGAARSRVRHLYPGHRFHPEPLACAGIRSAAGFQQRPYPRRPLRAGAAGGDRWRPHRYRNGPDVPCVGKRRFGHAAGTPYLARRG